MSIPAAMNDANDPDLSAELAQPHPRGLYVLFGAEMWERFSYYGMRALLVLYLTKKVGMTDDEAGLVYGTYTGLVYLTPLIGGLLADRYLGQRKAVLIGGMVMAMGHFAMAFEPLLYLALALLVIGNGFFKPNISTMVGNLYHKGDARRDSAYTIFYMGINTGAFLAPLVCGTLGENVSWHLGFAAAGVGMVFGVLNFVFFQHLLAGGFPPGRDEQKLSTGDYVQAAAYAVLALALAYSAIEAWPSLRPLYRPAFLNASLTWLYHGLLAVAGLTLLVTWSSRVRKGASPTAAGQEPFTTADWQRIGVIAIVSLFAAVFWSGFEQAGNTLNLFADRSVDRTLPALLQIGGKTEFPASYYQAANPLILVMLAPFFTILWRLLDGSKRIRVNSSAKFGFGLILLGIGYAVMYVAANRTVDGAKVGPQWLMIVYLAHSMGELCLSPIGLSLVNKLSPARCASLMMAIWFLTNSVGNYLAGTLNAILRGLDMNLWLFLTIVPVGSGLILLALNPILKRMAHGHDD